MLVAKQLKGGVECIMGIIRDPVFGPMAMFGLGGIFVEILKDVVFRRCPFGENVAEQMTLVITNSERGSSNVQIERAIGTRGLWGTRY